MGNKSGKSSSASGSIAETSKAHAQNVKDNPGFSLEDAGSALSNLKGGDLGILGSLIDELSGFGQSMINGNPMQKTIAAYMGMPVEMDYGKLGLSDMIAKLMPEDAAPPAAGQPTVGYNPADAFGSVPPPGQYRIPRGFM